MQTVNDYKSSLNGKAETTAPPLLNNNEINESKHGIQEANNAP